MTPIFSILYWGPICLKSKQFSLLHYWGTHKTLPQIVGITCHSDTGKILGPLSPLLWSCGQVLTLSVGQAGHSSGTSGTHSTLATWSQPVIRHFPCTPGSPLWKRQLLFLWQSTSPVVWLLTTIFVSVPVAKHWECKGRKCWLQWAWWLVCQVSVWPVCESGVLWSGGGCHTHTADTAQLFLSWHSVHCLHTHAAVTSFSVSTHFPMW